ncbi:Mur ligase family protein [Deinococcus sp.]|uniref:bifunctional folylpolyglutamate synthase/dihydrofolate synthase n=1 Tax=Deinococcus sp. TaxID=47478 RepID=UPI0025C6F830|nr:Mur ligase family protein [Deinococcus sp.]
MSPAGPDRNIPADLDWLFARQRFGVHPGLGRVRDLLAGLGDPQQHFRTVLVGGTNGKGSTAATLASILTAANTRAALFTSPHLTHFAERFVVAGQPLPQPVVLQALARVRPVAEQVGASFFEIVTALGCLLFAEAGAEVAVMEVGLGGRLDATNVLDPVLSVITNVALDHTAFLGETHQAIAREKAGILRQGRPAVTGVAPELWPILHATGADLWALRRELAVQVRPLGWEGSEVTLSVPGDQLTFRTPLLGLHGAQNAALAAAAALRLGAGGAVQAGTAAVQWPGRMEVLPLADSPVQGRILLDGAHNPAGAQALAAALRGLGVSSVPLIFGAAEDKDIGGVATALAPLASRVILTRAVLSPRAADPAHLAAHFSGVPVTLAPTPQEALAQVQAEALAVACGSLYLIGELRPLLLRQAAETRERWQ